MDLSWLAAVKGPALKLPSCSCWVALGFSCSLLHCPLLVEDKASWGECEGSPGPSAQDDQTLAPLGTGSYQEEEWKNMAAHGGSFQSLSGGGYLHLGAASCSREENRNRKTHKGGKKEFLISTTRGSELKKKKKAVEDGG